jgi:hypothetical protein
MMKETCINCKYNEKDTDDREGFCHRYRLIIELTMNKEQFLFLL